VRKDETREIMRPAQESSTSPADALVRCFQYSVIMSIVRVQTLVIKEEPKPAIRDPTHLILILEETIFRALCQRTSVCAYPVSSVSSR